MHALEEIPKAHKDSNPHKKADSKQVEPVWNTIMSRVNGGNPDTSYLAFDDRGAYHVRGSASMSNIVQRKITVELKKGENVPKIGINKERHEFRDPVKSLYKGDSIAHIIPFATIQSSMKEILNGAVAVNRDKPQPNTRNTFDLDRGKKADMQQLIKAIIPSAGYQFDIHEMLNLAPKIQNQQDVAKQINETIFDTNPMDVQTLEKKSNELLSVLNSSYANLRCGDKPTNRKIGNNLDPIAAAKFDRMSQKQISDDGSAASSFQISQKNQEAQIGVHLKNATMNELSLAKRMHKLGRLREKYPSLAVYGIAGAVDQESKKATFYSSDIPDTKDNNNLLSLHTHVEHMKGKKIERWKHDFTGNAGKNEEPLDSEVKQVSEPKMKSAAWVGAAVSGLTGLVTFPILGAIGGLLSGAILGAASFGGAYYYQKRQNNILISEKKRVEEIKFCAAKKQKNHLDAEASNRKITDSNEYNNMCSKFKNYSDNYDDLKKDPFDAKKHENLEMAYKEFHKGKLPLVERIREGKQ
ncbi:MAG: hypothetical protein HDR15_12430 [Lachnospiraceae bacterium]|nr:hypothetical protein [Lachnospiraceae bacterium]